MITYIVFVVAWVLRTEEGIILIDSMCDNRDAKLIENGYANLEKVANLKDGEKNPFIIGKDGIEQYLKSLQMEIDKKLNNN